jgi:GTP-binding protein
VNDISALLQFRFKKDFEAEAGGPGTTRLRDGARGDDLILKVPVGTVLTNLDTAESREITKEGERIVVAQGGYRGRGNFRFKGSTNTSPTESEEGKEGESCTYRLELKMIADVGLIGLPNAGKSSLLNALTGAHSKVGSYAFTTLEPHLGAYYGLILADVPGLIEGASDGKGLGDKFLRHIERTRVLFHLISAESGDVVADYRVIRTELAAYSDILARKEEYVLLTKSDMRDDAWITDASARLRDVNPHVLPISIIDDETLKPLRAILNAIRDERT